MKTVVVHAQQKWEYYFENRKTENSMLVALNEFGQQGWELVNISHHKDLKGEPCWTAFMKRPVTGQPQPQTTPANDTAASASPSSSGIQKLPQAQGFDLSDTEFKLRGE